MSLFFLFLTLIVFHVLQIGQTLPYRSSSNQVQVQAKDRLNPPCVAGQLGGTAEPTACDISSESELKACGSSREHRNHAHTFLSVCARLLRSKERE